MDTLVAENGEIRSSRETRGECIACVSSECGCGLIELTFWSSLDINRIHLFSRALWHARCLSWTHPLPTLKLVVRRSMAVERVDVSPLGCAVVGLNVTMIELVQVVALTRLEARCVDCTGRGATQTEQWQRLILQRHPLRRAPA